MTDNERKELNPSLEDVYSKVKKALLKKESSNEYNNTKNPIGFMGGYQFGASRLADLGYIKNEYIKKGTHKERNSVLQIQDAWTDKAKKNGVYSLETFLENTDFQDRVMDESLQKSYSRLQKFSGDEFKNLEIKDIAGYITASHIAGNKGAWDFYTNGINPKDDNDTTAKDYWELGSTLFEQPSKEPQQIAQAPKVKVSKPKKKFGSTRITSYYKSLFPEYEAQNPYHFRSQILQNDAYRRTYVTKLFNQIPEETLIEKHGEDYDANEVITKMDSNLVSRISKEAYTGDDIKTTLVKRGSELTKKAPNIFSVQSLKSTVSNNPKAFEQFGLTDGKNIVVDDKTLISKLSNSNNVRSKAFEERYDDFYDVLDNSNNTGGLDHNNIDQMAQAYAVYDRFGKEGLTQFINYQTEYDSDLSFQQQSPAGQKAYRWFKDTKVNGLAPNDVMAVFINGYGTELGELEYKEITPSRELEESVAKDYNNASKFFHDSKNPYEAIGKLIDVTKQADQSWFDEKWTGVFGEDQIDVDRVVSDLKIGADSEQLDVLASELFSLSLTGESGFTFKDWSDILVNASTEQSERDGFVSYRFNYEDLNERQRLALEVVKSNVLEDVRHINDDVIEYTPNDTQRVQQKAELGGVYWKQEAQYDSEGNFVGFKEVVDNDSFGSGLTNTLFSTAVNLSQFVGGTAKLVADASLYGLEELGGENISRGIRNSGAYRAVEDYLDYDVYQDAEGFWQNSLLFGTELGAYVLTAGAMGGGIIKGASKAVSKFQKFRTLQALKTAGDIAKTSKYGKISTRVRNYAKMGKMSERGAGALNIELGAGIIEGLKSFDEDQTTMFSMMPQSVQQSYIKSDMMGKVFANVLSSVGVGMLVDNLWAGSKFATNVGFGRKQSRGLIYNSASKNYEMVARPQFVPDWRRAWANASRNLSDIPAGDIQEAVSNMLVKKATKLNPDNINTLSDMTVNFFDQVEPVMKDAKQQIELALKEYDIKFYGKEGKNTFDRADVLYTDMLNTISTGIQGVLRESGAENLIPKFTQQLRQTSPTTRQVKDENGRSIFSKAEANTHATRTPNGIIKRNKNGGYLVYETDPSFWANDLANSLDNLNKAPSVARNTRNLAKIRNVDQTDLNANEKLAEEVQSVIGSEVVHKGEIVQITDITENGYKGIVRRTGESTEEFRSYDLDVKRNEINSSVEIDYASKTDPTAGQLLLPPARTTNDVTPQQSMLAKQMADIYQQLGGIRVTERDGSSVTTGKLLPEPYRDRSLVDIAINTEDITELSEATTRLVNDFGYTQDQIQELVGRSKFARKNIADNRPLGLPERGSGNIKDDAIEFTLRRLETKYQNFEDGLEEIAVLKGLGVPEEQIYKRVAEPIVDKTIKVRRKLNKKLDELEEAKRKEYSSDKTKEASLSKRRETIRSIIQEELDPLEAQLGIVRRNFEGDPMAFPVEKQIKEYTERLQKSFDNAQQASKAPEEKVIVGNAEDTVLKDKGVGSRMVNDVLPLSKTQVDSKKLQKLVRALGTDNDVYIGKVAKNKTDISEFNGGAVPKGTVVKDKKGNYFMAKTNKTKGAPIAWLMDANGVPVMSKHWSAIGINQTLNPDGSLKKFVSEGNNIFREASESDTDFVYLKILNPVDDIDMSTSDMIKRQFDAQVVRSDDNKLRYKVLSEKEQSVNPRKFDQYEEKKANKQDIIDNC